MVNTESTAAPPSEYRQWVIGIFRSVVPAKCVIIECEMGFPSLLPFVCSLSDGTPLPKQLRKYHVEWCPSPLQQHLQAIARYVNVRPRPLDRDASQWEAQEQNASRRYVVRPNGWQGIICVSRANKRAYFCLATCDSGKGLQTLALTAYDDEKFLTTLMLDLRRALTVEVETKRTTTIFCGNGPDIELEDVSLDRVILPTSVKKDIVDSIIGFYTRVTAFKGLGVPSKRGLLFAGVPGCGKTLLCHALANHVVKNCGVRVGTIRICRNLGNDDVEGLYGWASTYAPSMLILEDIDSVLCDTQVTRSGLLNVLDGLKTERGVLTIATTNYPERLDPALAHRPSRFDRVWHIGLPDEGQRSEFLRRLFDGCPLGEERIEAVVRKTNGWSMAYVQELKATAVVAAIRASRDHLLAADVDEAVELLSRQFRSGKRNHQNDEPDGRLGFAA